MRRYISFLLNALLSFLVFFFSANVVFATPVNYGYQLQRLSTEEGLSQGTVNTIAQDEFGYLWFGTDRGLNRYDGYQLNLFNGADPALASDAILAITPLKNGNFLVSAQLNGLFLVDPASLSSQQLLSNPLSEVDAKYATVWEISQDNNNQDIIWLGINHQVYKYSLTNRSLELVFSLNNPTHMVRALLPHEDSLYIGTSTGLFRYHNGTSSALTHLPTAHASNDQRNIKFLQWDNEFGLLVGTVEGLYRRNLEGQKPVIETLIDNHNIWSLQRYGTVDFVATEDGLLQFNRQTRHTTNLIRFSDSRYAVNDNNVMSMFRDKSGMLWLGSQAQGVFSWSPLAMRFKQKALATGKYQHGHAAWAIYEQDNGTLWVGSGNGLNKIPKEGPSTTLMTLDDKKMAMGQQTVYQLQLATHVADSLWVLAIQGSALLNMTTNNVSYPLKNAAHPIGFDAEALRWGLYQLANGMTYFIAQSGFYRFDPASNTIEALPSIGQQLQPEHASHFLPPLPTHKDDPLISYGGGLYRYDVNNDSLHPIYEPKYVNAQSNNLIDSWTLDQNNSLWISIDGEGVVALDLETLEERDRIGPAQGLRSLSVFTPVLDNFGFLWFGSNNGLYRYNINSGHLRHFSVKDGLSAAEFNGFSATKLASGELAFGTVKGLLIVDPADFITATNHYIAPAPQITDINLLSRPLDYTPSKYANTPLQLQHDDLGLTISFSSFDYIHRDQVRYKISLSGASEFKYPNYASNNLQFATLNPGAHQLSISAFDPVSGKWSRTLHLGIEVAYAPWRSPVAITLYIVISALLLGTWMLWLRRQQRRLHSAHGKLLASQQQTDLALQSSNSGIWHYQVEQRRFMQRRLAAELGYREIQNQCSFEQYVDLIHPQDVDRYRLNWKRFLNQGEQATWDFTYRLCHKQGTWHWYHEVGRITEYDANGQPKEVSGIYTNITDAKASAQQATVLGEAIGQISDWLLILDEHLQPFSANDSFLRAFSDPNSPGLSIQPFVRALGKQKFQRYMGLIGKLAAGDNWRIEEQIRTKHDMRHPVQISVTAVCRDKQEQSDEISYYVVVITDLTEQKRAEDELRYLANYDPLTGLPNRTMMRGKIAQAIDYAKENSSLLALLFIDLDKFKPVNDSFGHAVGDQVLCCICERISEQLDDNSLLARQSGDEFLLLIEQVQSPQSLSELSEHLAKTLEKPIKIGNITINISVSIGIALSPFDADNAEDLIRNADMAMIYAKNAGRNGYKFFTEQMNNRITHKLMLENALQDAYRDDLLTNHYQPIVHIHQKRIVGVELLLRWQSEGQFISPAEFIPVAEEIGLIDAITEQALHRALRELKQWFSTYDDFYLSVNLSPIHILKSNLTERLVDILAMHDVSPAQLRLEITESTLLDDKAKAAAQLNKLRAAGLKLFLDDFGTGYSSLTYLNQFPIDVIKIDQSFVRQIGINPTNEAIIRTIHNLASSLGLYCIAEGVETREQIFFLNKLGCHHLQGFFFAKPCDAATLAAKYYLEKTLEKMNSL
ncbi:EAL domain-containing protein [Pseudoalteromonas sp. T1lg48]|uniref:EAL domain-containing protein n=1 Tax=Pseudoalteromonas sp. T1lg48 TaxID=2077100 RepID=UPI000CF6A2BD|nr:EAL domain-containing protein [Pseudoalteromonas sp. T1lg48]